MAVAYHEAGHVVVGRLLGLQLLDADLYPDGEGGRGHTNFAHPGPWFTPQRGSLTRAERDLIEWNPTWLYYGTLFPSYPRSREVLLALVAVLPHAARFYDLNVRTGFDCASLVGDLLQSADVVKVNEEELQFVHDSLGLPVDPEGFCREGSARYHWRAACVTLGARGCAMLAGGDYVQAGGFPVDVADTVGAGDAFAAAFLHGLVANWPVAKIAEFSNRVGAFVASVHGAIPDEIPDSVFDT